MHTVVFRLHPGYPQVVPTSASVADFLRENVESGDGLEHVHVQAGPAEISIVLFIAQTDSAIAVAVARSHVEQMIAIMPQLKGWTWSISQGS